MASTGADLRGDGEVKSPHSLQLGEKPSLKNLSHLYVKEWHLVHDVLKSKIHLFVLIKTNVIFEGVFFILNCVSTPESPSFKHLRKKTTTPQTHFSVCRLICVMARAQVYKRIHTASNTLASASSSSRGAKMKSTADIMRIVKCEEIHPEKLFYNTAHISNSKHTK